MRTNRVTSYGKGDASRSDPAKFREGLSWQHEWCKDFPKKEGGYMVKYYDESNKLRFIELCVVRQHEDHYDSFWTVYDEAIGELIRLKDFCENKVGLQWKFQNTI